MSLFNRTKAVEAPVLVAVPMPPVVEAAPPTPPPPVVKKPIKALSSSVRNGKAGSEPPSTFLLIKDKVQQELINDLKQNPSSLDLESGR